MVRLCADPLHMNCTMVPYFDRPIAFPFREASHIDIVHEKRHMDVLLETTPTPLETSHTFFDVGQSQELIMSIHIYLNVNTLN